MFGCGGFGCTVKMAARSSPSSSVKLDNYVRPFRGQGDDFEMFWAKYMVLCGIQKLSMDAQKMSVFPLFLEGDAFQVLMQMPPADQMCVDAVKKKMEEAFSMSHARAYQLFRARALRADESADAYVADLKRLLTLSGHSISGEKESVLLEQLVAGLSVEYARQIRMAFAGQEMTVVGCLDRICALRVSEDDASASRHSNGARPVVAAPVSRQIVCYHCKESGHVKRNCPLRNQSEVGSAASPGVSDGASGNGSSGATDNSSGANGGSKQKKIVRYFCDKGHIKQNCPERKKWQQHNRSTTAALNVATPDPCLCSGTPDRKVPLPKIYVDVRAVDSDAARQRVRAAVDTCACRSLASQKFTERMELTIEPHDEELVGLGGEPVLVRGCVTVSLQRNDERVQLPCTNMKFLIVDQLDVVSADLVIGVDVISRLGGVDLSYDEDGALCGVTIRPESNHEPEVVAATSSNLSRHVAVRELSNGDVELNTDDFALKWLESVGYWQVSWKWASGTEPEQTVGHGITEYSRSHLTAEEEELFQAEVKSWLDNGWLFRTTRISMAILDVRYHLWQLLQHTSRLPQCVPR